MSRYATPFADLLPPLSTQEREALAASIALEGVREPVVVDELGQVLDGHHRLAIAPDAPCRVVSGLSDAEKRAYVYSANFTRRNLSPDQKRERLKRMKEVAAALRAEDPVKNTHGRIAALLGVARQTVTDWLPPKEDISVAGSGHAYMSHKEYNPTTKGKIPPRERPVIVERLDAGETQAQVAADYGVEQPRIAQIATKERQAAEKKREREETVAQIGDAGVQCGDFRELGQAIPDGSVDLIFTDPPYNQEAIPLYSALAELASRVLRPGGWCLAYSGQTWLPQVMQQMSEHLTYGWVFAIQHTGGDLRYRNLKLQNGWKPILGFYRPPLNVWWDWFPDLTSGGREKEDHHWQQATAEARHFITALCPVGGVVLDPMVGSGTTCVAALLTKRQWIAFDNDQEAVAKARARVGRAILEGRA